METLLQNCGYLAAFIGTILEGEILFLTAVLTSKLGYINFYGVLLAVFLGAQLHDWTWFLIIKSRGQQWVDNQPKLQSKLINIRSLMDTYPMVLLVFYRFMIGVRSIALILIGLSKTSYQQFALFSALSAALWVALIGSVGYFCAETLIERIEWVQDHSWIVIGVLVCIGLLYWLVKHFPIWRTIRMAQRLEKID